MHRGASSVWVAFVRPAANEVGHAPSDAELLRSIVWVAKQHLKGTALNIRTIYPVIEWYRSGLVSVG